MPDRDQLFDLLNDESLTDDDAVQAVKEALSVPLEDDDGGAYPELLDFSDAVLRLAYRGRRYKVPACSVELGELAVVSLKPTSKISAAAQERMAELENADFFRAMLGGDPDSPLYDPATDVFAQLLADGASWKVVEHFAITAMMWAVYDTAAAVDYFTAAKTAPKARTETPPPPNPTGTRPPASSSKPPAKRTPARKSAGTAGRKS